MHPLIARVTGTRWVAADRDEDFGLDPDRAARVIEQHRPDVVFLTSPNNPTGTSAPIEAIEAVCDAAPGIVVVDEAYAEFAREGSRSALSLLPRYPALVVTRTMSKAFAMAGARIGYLAAAPDLVEKLLLVRLPYHLSAVTQAVGRAALAHAAEPLATVAVLRAERDALVGWLRQRGLRGGGLRRELRPVRRVRRSRTRSGRRCSTWACSSARSARRGGCGSRWARRRRWPRSSTALDEVRQGGRA